MCMRMCMWMCVSRRHIHIHVRIPLLLRRSPQTPPKLPCPPRSERAVISNVRARACASVGTCACETSAGRGARYNWARASLLQPDGQYACTCARHALCNSMMACKSITGKPSTSRSIGHRVNMQAQAGTHGAACTRVHIHRHTDAMAVLSAQILLAACSTSSFFPPQSSPS